MSVGQLGNILDSYFTAIALTFYDEKDFVFDKCEYNIYNSSDSFYDELPKFLKCDMEIKNKLHELPDDFMNNLKTSHRHNDSWVISDNNSYQYWKIMKPTIHRILNNLFEKYNLIQNVKYPIIHFRCSDVPFARHEKYYMQKFQFYKDSLMELKSKNVNIDKFSILTGMDHKCSSENSKMCNIYIDMLRIFLHEMNVETEVEKNANNLEDFAKLFYAPAVITTGSSFAFMSAFFGNGIYITACTKNNNNCKTDDNFIKTKYRIWHNDVKDYYDKDEMKTHLYNENVQ